MNESTPPKLHRAFSLVEMLLVFAKAIDKGCKVGCPIDGNNPSKGILGPSPVRFKDLD